MAIVTHDDAVIDSPSFLRISDPLEPELIFARPAPLEIEVGCGNGHFLTGLSAQRPDRNYLGIDIRYKRIEKSCRKADRLPDRNCRFLLGDAYRVLADGLPAGSADTVYVNFPDPWPKYKHRKFRLNTERFIRLIARVLKSGGYLWWVCDHYPQIVDVVGLCRWFEREGVLRNCCKPDGFSLEEPEYPETLYEKKWRESGRPIFYVRFERI